MVTKKQNRRPTKRELVEQARAEEPPSHDEEAQQTTTSEPIPEPTPEEIEDVLESLSSPLIEENDEGDMPLDEDAEDWENEPPIAALPRLVTSGGTLVAHAGARKITREELALVPTPDATRTHQPVPHIRVVEAVAEALSFRHITVVREEYAVTPDGGKMFGVLDLDYESRSLDSFRFSVGLRNSNDKTMRLGVTVGYRVLVCDNMAFRGDFTPVLAKHSHRLDLDEVITLGVDRMQRGFAPLREQITGWQRRELTDREAKLVIYEAFVDGALPLPKHLLSAVHRHYFRPEYEAFAPRTLWSLSNAFTSAFKLLKPVQQFQATARLGDFMARRAEDLGDRMQAAPPVHEEAARFAHA